MPSSGSSLQEVHQSIVEGYSRDELRRVVSTCLHENYDLLVSPDKPYVDQAFDFVQWAERQGRLQELADCLRRAKPTPAPGDPPYKGLAYFGAADAALFFGREILTGELVTYLKEHRFLAVVGASGSGKSSVVRAGVVPALQRGEVVKGGDQWAVHIVTPTARPLQALAAALTKESESVTAQATLMDDMAEDARSLDLFASRLLARTGAPRLLLVVDQFEELFTLCKDRAEQQAYVDNLLAAAVPDGATTVILTLRADFYARCGEFANLRTALQDYQKYIGPMSPAELRAAIEKPAQAHGWDFEPGLVDAILSDIAGEAGSLPLLSHALLETWQRRSGRLLTFAGYHAAGGVQGAIAKTADGVYAELPPDQQAIARSIFLRLTTLGEGVQDTRRRAPLPELLGSSAQAAQVQAVLKRLEDERLVTAERAPAERAGAGESAAAVYVDVTHEALIRAWPRLATWLNEDREGLLVHRRLTEAAQEWHGLGRDPSALFRGARLAQTAEWAAGHDGDLNDLEREFLATSQAQLEAEKRRRQRVIAGIVLGLALFAVTMAVLAVVANNLRIDADNARGEAVANALEAKNQEGLAIEAKAIADAYAVAAMNAKATAQANATEADTARATAQANLDLAQQKLDELKVEELLTSGRDKRALLDVYGAIADFEAAAETASAKDKKLDVTYEISDTLRFAATTYVQEGEKILCEALFGEPEKCTVPYAGQAATPMTTSMLISQVYMPLPSQAAAPMTTSVTISQTYLAWAQATAPQIAGWPSYTSAVQQQAVISATALYSQALALNPPSDTLVYVWIAPGSFAMGSTDEQVDYAIRLCTDNGMFCDGSSYSDQQPSHTVELDAYWIQRTEVTNEQYKRCVDAGACEPPYNLFWDNFRSSRLPVTDINWNQASAYATWVGSRLPTEAEWEYACRSADGRIYPWGNEPPAPERLNYNYEMRTTMEVATYPPGVNDLYDMVGNVLEWTSDWYDVTYYKNSPKHNPVGPDNPGSRTLRGGAWNDLVADVVVRCAGRMSFGPDFRNADIGFRVASPGFGDR